MPTTRMMPGSSRRSRRSASRRHLTVWTCTLRSNVLFADGSRFDANDVVQSFAVQWDADHPLHHGRTGAFDTFAAWFGGFLDPPPS